MENIRVLIVEDNALAAEALSITLKKHSLSVVQICDSGETAIDYVKNNDVDLVLMDIVLSGAVDGISAAQLIRQHRPVPVIYLTDHVDQKNFDRAKKTHPANYLSKPYNEGELIRAIDIAFSNSGGTVAQSNSTKVREHIFVRTDSQQFLRIFYRDVLYLEADRSYCKVITDDNIYILCKSMNQVQEKFDNTDFVRIHRSYVVNTQRITRIEGNIVVLGSRKIDMGKDYREDLMSRLKLIK